MNGILKRFFHLVLVSFCLSTVLLAQSGEVSLRGQVTDQSGAVVPYIPVTLIGPGGVTREATTDDSDGRYIFRDLPNRRLSCSDSIHSCRRSATSLRAWHIAQRRAS